MAESLCLDEHRLVLARSELVRASEELRSVGSRVPCVAMQSLTGIGGEVQEYLETVRVASQLLAEGANAAGAAASTAIQVSTDTDRSVAAALNLGAEGASVSSQIGQEKA